MSDITVGDKVEVQIEGLEHIFKCVELYTKYKLYVLQKVEVARIKEVPK